MPAVNGAEQLRVRGKRMLELATRAHCEKNDYFASLLTQLAVDLFAHAKEFEERCELPTAPNSTSISAMTATKIRTRLMFGFNADGLQRQR